MLLSIYGESGVGKSSIAIRCTELRSDITRIIGDFLIVPRANDITIHDYFKQPIVYDWDLVRTFLNQPKYKLLSLPDFDFATYQRRSLVSNRKFSISDINIIDSIVPCPLADYHINVIAPNKLRRERILKRDLEWKTSVIDLWDNNKITKKESDRVGIKPTLTLDGSLDISENAMLVIDLLKAHS